LTELQRLNLGGNNFSCIGDGFKTYSSLIGLECVFTPFHCEFGAMCNWAGTTATWQSNCDVPCTVPPGPSHQPFEWNHSFINWKLDWIATSVAFY